MKGEMNDSLLDKLIETAASKVSPEHSAIFQREVVEQVNLLRRSLSHNLLDSFSTNQVDLPRKVTFTSS